MRAGMSTFGFYLHTHKLKGKFAIKSRLFFLADSNFFLFVNFLFRLEHLFRERGSSSGGMVRSFVVHFQLTIFISR